MCLEAAAIQRCAHAISTTGICEAGIPRLDTADLFAQLVQLSKGASIQDVAATAQEALARGMAILGMKIAEERNISSIAFSGGVAYNDHISSRIRDLCGTNGFQFFTNHLVPCGDGGVSLEQEEGAAFLPPLAVAMKQIVSKEVRFLSADLLPSS